jgi:hypothetical protein
MTQVEACRFGTKENRKKPYLRIHILLFLLILFPFCSIFYVIYYYSYSFSSIYHYSLCLFFSPSFLPFFFPSLSLHVLPFLQFLFFLHICSSFVSSSFISFSHSYPLFLFLRVMALTKERSGLNDTATYGRCFPTWDTVTIQCWKELTVEITVSALTLIPAGETGIVRVANTSTLHSTMRWHVL